MTIGMCVLCNKSLDSGDLRKTSEIFSIAVTVTLAVTVLVMFGTLLFTEQIADLLDAKEFGIRRVGFKGCIFYTDGGCSVGRSRCRCLCRESLIFIHDADPVTHKDSNL